MKNFFKFKRIGSSITIAFAALVFSQLAHAEGDESPPPIVEQPGLGQKILKPCTNDVIRCIYVSWYGAVGAIGGRLAYRYEMRSRAEAAAQAAERAAKAAADLASRAVKEADAVTEAVKKDPVGSATKVGIKIGSGLTSVIIFDPATLHMFQPVVPEAVNDHRGTKPDSILADPAIKEVATASMAI